ncbi:MAG: hypothetical protein ACRDM7_01780 [Thermoleophilaceae bacterium]
MSQPTVPSVRPQPMIVVADVEKSSLWYQGVLGATSGHGGPEYEQVLVDGNLIMQLHQLDVAHHHGTIGDPGQPTGNGVAIWFGQPMERGAAPMRRTGTSARAVSLGCRSSVPDRALAAGQPATCSTPAPGCRLGHGVLC